MKEDTDGEMGSETSTLEAMWMIMCSGDSQKEMNEVQFDNLR